MRRFEVIYLKYFYLIGETKAVISNVFVPNKLYHVVYIVSYATKKYVLFTSIAIILYDKLDFNYVHVFHF